MAVMAVMAVMVVLVGLSVRHGGGTGVVTLSILLSPHPLSLRPTPVSSPDCTTPGQPRHSDGDKVMRTLLPSDYAVMVDYKIIQAGPPLVITYLLSLNSRGLGEAGLTQPHLTLTTCNDFISVFSDN